MVDNVTRNVSSCFCFAGYDYCNNDVDCYCKKNCEQDKNTKED